LLNVCGYYDRLIAFLDHAVEQQFVQATHRHAVLIADQAEALLDACAAYQSPGTNKAEWILRMSSGSG
jgi:predicted Rossmann-fold nucleotide-binding protein